MIAQARRGGFRDQVRITGKVEDTPRPRRKANPLGRSKTTRVQVMNPLDELRADVREVVERVARDRGVKLVDVRVIHATEAIIP
ncbi:hypothetical protein [Streptomyces sp. NPDC002644]